VTRRDERGQGLIPTLGGFTVVLALLLLATQVVFDLYARSAVNSAAVDAARSVAGYQASRAYPSDPSGTALQTAVGRAESRARAALGSFGQVTAFRWAFVPSADGGVAEVDVTVGFDLRGTHRSVVGALALPGLDRFERTVKVRVEHVTCPTGRSCRTIDPPPAGP